MIEVKMDKEGKNGAMEATSTVTGQFDTLKAATKFVRTEAEKFMEAWAKATVSVQITLKK